MPTAGGSVSGHESQAGGSKDPPEGEAGPAGHQRAAVCSEDGPRCRLTLFQHKQCMLSLAVRSCMCPFIAPVIICGTT